MDRVIIRNIEHTCSECGSHNVCIGTSVMRGNWHRVNPNDTLVISDRHCQDCGYNETIEDVYPGTVQITADHYVVEEYA